MMRNNAQKTVSRLLLVLTCVSVGACQATEPTGANPSHTTRLSNDGSIENDSGSSVDPVEQTADAGGTEVSILDGGDGASLPEVGSDSYDGGFSGHAETGAEESRNTAVVDSGSGFVDVNISVTVLHRESGERLANFTRVFYHFGQGPNIELPRLASDPFVWVLTEPFHRTVVIEAYYQEPTTREGEPEWRDCWFLVRETTSVEADPFVQQDLTLTVNPHEVVICDS